MRFTSYFRHIATLQKMCNKQDCQSRPFWRELSFWSGSGSYSYSYSTVNILFLRDLEYDYNHDYDYDDYDYDYEYYCDQCCGAGPFLTSSGSRYFFSPAPAPYHIKIG